jgi:hypothetical protein
MCSCRPMRRVNIPSHWPARSRILAPLRCGADNFPKRAQQREIQRHAHRFGTERARQRRVAMQLRAITLRLPVDEILARAALVRAGLVVGDPALRICINEGAIKDDVDDAAFNHAAQSTFTARIAVRAVEQPATARIGQTALQRRADLRRRRVTLVRLDTQIGQPIEIVSRAHVPR